MNEFLLIKLIRVNIVDRKPSTNTMSRHPEESR